MSLAEANEPIILADGTKIDPVSGSVVKEKKYGNGMIAIPSASEAVDIVVKSRRSVADMPVPPQQMNGISLVVFYSMWGLNDQDIAIHLSITTDQVKNIKKSPEFKTLRNDVFANIMETEATDIRGFFQQRAKNAAQKVVDSMEEEGALGFKAAQDILDRAGHRPADVVEHRHRLDNALQIQFIRKDNPTEAPVIDADFREVE